MADSKKTFKCIKDESSCLIPWSSFGFLADLFFEFKAIFIFYICKELFSLLVFAFLYAIVREVQERQGTGQVAGNFVELTNRRTSIFSQMGQKGVA